MVLFILCVLPLAVGLVGAWFVADTYNREVATVTVQAQATDAAASLLAAPPPDWDLALEERFVTDANWSTGTVNDRWRGTLTKTIEADRYRWEIMAVDSGIWMSWAAVIPTRDFYVQLDARQIEGASLYFSYGIVFRYANETTYSMFVIAEDQNSAAWTRRSRQWEDLIPWTYTPAIRPGAFNTLAIRAEGEYLAFFVNNQLVGETYDDSPINGKIGIIIYASEAENEEAVFVFDNFLLYLP